MKNINELKNSFTHSNLYSMLKIKGYFNLLPDKYFLKLEFRRKFGRALNLKSPKTFNEKLQWLKLYNRESYYPLLADKYEVKNYLKNIISQEHIIETYAVYDNVEEINIDALPNKFVLKTTHNSGGISICKNKDSFDLESAKKKLEIKSKQNFYWYAREWVYKDIKPRIIAERYLEDPDNKDIMDYKFFCFNGKPLVFKIDFDRFTDHKANYYDINCNLLPFGEIECPPDFNRKLLIPENFDEMIKLTEKISANIPFLRVDLYNVNKQIFFGEATFFPAAGFGPFTVEEWDSKLGDFLELPQKK